MRDRFGVSERRACTVVGIHRSTMRLTPAPITTEEAELRAWLRRFSTERPRWGWRRAAKMARRPGWQVNNKRIHRLWRAEGLRVPQRRRKKRLTGIGVAVGAMSPIRPNAIWAMDFQFDTTADGRILKMLNVIESSPVKRSRSRLIAASAPTVSSRCWIDWLSPTGRRTTCGSTTARSSWRTPCMTGADSTVLAHFSSIQGRRGRNAWIESFNGRLRDELLNAWRFDSLLEARVIIEDWRRDYNANRPHSAHGELTPAESALQWTTTHQPQAA
ncbi:transposase [Mycobacterium mantenii]|uniref:Transposase n=1 Tax=Mycobacterium mantenii TaxID=560555 RepID=A0ABM7K0I9_MYCNT|nr:transposase [Mycobacterium mantenii]